MKKFKKPIFVGKDKEGFRFVYKVDLNDPCGQPTAYGHTKDRRGKVVSNWSVDLAKAKLPIHWKQWE